MWFPALFVMLGVYALTFITGFVLFGRLRLQYKLLTVLTLAAGLCEVCTRFEQTAWYFYVYPPIEKALLAIIYILEMKPGKTLRLIITVWTVVIVGIDVYLYFRTDDYYFFPMIQASLSGIFTCFLAIACFYFMIARPLLTAPLHRQPVFWMNTANLLFYSITFFTFSVYQLYNWPREHPWILEMIFYANLTLYLSYLVAICIEASGSKKAQKV